MVRFFDDLHGLIWRAFARFADVVDPVFSMTEEEVTRKVGHVSEDLRKQLAIGNYIDWLTKEGFGFPTRGHNLEVLTQWSMRLRFVDEVIITNEGTLLRRKGR